MHPAQDVHNNVRLPGNVVNGKVEFLKSVQPPNLAGGRLSHGLEVLQRGTVGVDDDWESAQVVPPLVGRFHKG